MTLPITVTIRKNMNKTIFLNIRMTQELRDTLQKLADKECRSLAGQITYMLMTQLADKKGKV